MYIVTIDTGTTNTRVKVWKQDRLLTESFRGAGVRDTAITGSKHKLQQAVREAIHEAVDLAGAQLDNVGLILASGMITSNVGLYEVPHAWAPAGVDELAAGMVRAVIPEVADNPIWFIPGVKNNLRQITLDNCDQMDIMRGEEVETFGVIAKMGLSGPAVFVLPGSHSKFISVDAQNRIAGCITTLAGELLGVVTNHTILANALKSSFADSIAPDMLLKGASYAMALGLNRTCFMVRLLDQFTGYGVNQKANFLLGAILGTDLCALKNSQALQVTPDIPIIVMGKKILKEAFAVLLANDEFFRGKVMLIDEDIQRDIAGYGAMVIARRKGLVD